MIQGYGGRAGNHTRDYDQPIKGVTSEEVYKRLEKEAEEEE